VRQRVGGARLRRGDAAQPLHGGARQGRASPAPEAIAHAAVELDHVLLGVADLEAGARALEERYGLKALAGGRHPGAGTANMIVPIGSEYLELIAVVDDKEAEGHERSRRVRAAVEAGQTFVAWALRTDDIEALRKDLIASGWSLPEISDGSRRQPDGSELRWRTQVVDGGVFPFVIEWQVPKSLHPAHMRVEHPSGLDRIGDVVLESDDPSARKKLDQLVEGRVAYGLREGPLNNIRELILSGPGGTVRLT
jgi:Glyoxalase-like domain